MSFVCYPIHIGRDRFVENLSNLGSFITKYDAKMLKYETENVLEGMPYVQTKVCVINVYVLYLLLTTNTPLNSVSVIP